MKNHLQYLPAALALWTIAIFYIYVRIRTWREDNRTDWIYFGPHGYERYSPVTKEHQHLQICDAGRDKRWFGIDCDIQEIVRRINEWVITTRSQVQIDLRNGAELRWNHQGVFFGMSPCREALTFRQSDLNEVAEALGGKVSHFSVRQDFFVLGGPDGEMVRIAEVLKSRGIPHHVSSKWGVKLSDLGGLVDRLMKDETKRSVFVEVGIDGPIPQGSIVIDHHGDRTSEPASILQVLKLLGVEPTRLDVLVAANDSGWFDGLEAVNATESEIAMVRALDRKAQGITEEEEGEADRALSAPPSFVGNIRVIRMKHSRKATVDDRLYLEAKASGTKVSQFVILSGDGESNYQGTGKVARALNARFPGGWSGGTGLNSEVGTAYWGGRPNREELLKFLEGV